ncbi:MAG: c-type cytochrome [Sulfurimonas sp.]|uniref:c-type cytochrome n=1 Tax=Sulfurimonas sp. TaxID=2022749 RepID=UPI00261644F8|nr:c-type cytochrome [Sulfurimonas sp.]MCW8894863.1 c-type cytochrome [Sulfurimonas sp.]MCW8953727.1 c-type cytochrome [Sulfurimonas sp.]MCW9067180.1 c-type cytochrome [Sulfurimonas sp.]
MKIVIPIALALLLSACSEENKSSSSQVKTAKEPTQKVEVVEKKVQETAVEEAVVEEVETVAKEVEAAAAEVKAAVPARTGQTIFTACSACHGADASKVALGKSQVIKGWDSAKIQNALNGYKDGTYGGAMKGIMKGQVTALSDEEIKAVSEYISKL